MSTETFTSTETSRNTSGSFGLLWRYLCHVPFLLWALIPNCIFAIVLGTGYQFFIWLSGKLAECSSERGCQETRVIADFHVIPNFTLLATLVVILIVIRIVQWNFFEAVGQLATRDLIRRTIHGVGRVRTTFFDEYPSGKIINRLVRDTDSLRVYGPIRIGDTVSSIAELLVVAVVISFASPLAALIAVPTFLLFVYVQRNVAPMLQHIMVLRSARFGEVLHRESDIIEGVRAFALYGQLPALMQRLTTAVYRFMQMHFLRGQIEAWGRLLCDLGVAVYGCAVLCAVSVGIHTGALSAVMGVVILTASFRLGSIFSWLTWSMGQLFETAGHARRVFEYVDLPLEETEEGITPRDHSCSKPEGDLCFSSYTMSYREKTPIILNNLSLRIECRTKVGLIGRTGAGKSSLVQSLFRMVYVRGGDICVGETSLFSLPIEQARALFAVVPQDPYLFEGTIRSNLDRVGEYTDVELKAALKKAQLSLDLEMPLLEGGSNLSVGQRQLVCLTRVIVTKRPFVIMDEPTSAVDTITDAAIQSVLATALADRTIITIAHRLETLARMDRIVELEDGVIVRDGSPDVILPLITPDELA
jgi:ATP-binding cassette subfamily C (CFTR/MRP) protein 1